MSGGKSACYTCAMLEWVRRVTGAESAVRAERIQSLWSGYGEVVRVRLTGASAKVVIVKRVEPPHGRGRSHERKLRSYAVERAWYRRYAARCDEHCRVPRCLAVEETESGWLFLLEDLDAAGFSTRRHALTDRELDRGLAWLANFHATFLGERPAGLWETGTYWHLATRPDELAVIDDPALVDAARRIDARLSACEHPTLVHGDAKLANFGFTPDGASVAAVDFQYVGGGCGMKDVAYFLFSGHGWGEREPDHGAALDTYFRHLREALARRGASDGRDVEREWRALYPFARADFHRFLAGWSPSRASMHAFREAVRALPEASGIGAR